MSVRRRPAPSPRAQHGERVGVRGMGSSREPGHLPRPLALALSPLAGKGDILACAFLSEYR